MPQITIVSNRLPISVKKVNDKLEFYPSVGGLATALSSYVTNKQNKWIGWPGVASDDLTEKEKRTIARELLKSNCYPVFLNKKQIHDYYSGYSNTILWPLFHNLPVKLEDHDKYWKAYKEINELFTEATLALSKPGATVWIHDYQLLLMPEMLRVQQPQDNIGLFLHIPFPDAKSFSKLASGKKLIKGMLGAGLIGFHTNSYGSHFLDSVDRLNAGIAGKNEVIVEDRFVRVTDFPIGIDYAKYTKSGNSKAVREYIAKFHKKYGRRKIILTVDRLDPTKGLVHRLEAFREFLATHGKMHSKVVMVMLAVPSRTEIEEYRKLKDNVESLVAEINNMFGNRRWQPIDYMYKSVPFEELTALYQIAHVAFITPLRDGMNLVAKEYVAAQANHDGVLILSTTAGAAEEMTNAILVNPKKRDSLVNALNTSLTMPKLELRQRLKVMQNQLSNNTVHEWAGSFIKTLQKPHNPKSMRTPHLNGTQLPLMMDHYTHTKRRLILLDYDGTLADFALHHSEAKPSASLYELLKNLANDKCNEIVIISGRDKKSLEDWLGHLRISMVAEHGASVKVHGGKWQKTFAAPDNWKKPVKKLMNNYLLITPGATIEEKENSLVWHYRKSPPYYAQTNTVILKTALKSVLLGTGFAVYSGNKILEVRPKGVNKGDTARQWIKPDTDFILAIGDDYTDEDMFEKLPASAYTIKIGRGRTVARFRLDRVKDVLVLLGKLSKQN